MGLRLNNMPIRGRNAVTTTTLGRGFGRPAAECVRTNSRLMEPPARRPRPKTWVDASAQSVLARRHPWHCSTNAKEK
jgi:hypothetical protein